jgi:hypothetical protein
MSPRFALAALLSLPLAACGGVVPPATSYTPPPAGPPAAKRLTQMFGTPRLDIRETTVRKLQFANGRCVLDAYLYSPGKGKEPVVTHVDARTPAGTNVDHASCAATLQQR